MDHRDHVRLGVGVGSQHSGALTTPDRIGRERHPRLGVMRKERAHRLGAIERLAQEQARTIRIFGKKRDRLVEHRLQAPGPGCGSHQTRERVVPSREQTVEHRPMQLLLAAEVPEQGSLADTDRVGDVLERGSVQAFLGEQPRRRGEDAGPHSDAPRFPPRPSRWALRGEAPGRRTDTPPRRLATPGTARLVAGGASRQRPYHPVRLSLPFGRDVLQGLPTFVPSRARRLGCDPRGVAGRTDASRRPYGSARSLETTTTERHVVRSLSACGPASRCPDGTEHP